MTKKKMTTSTLLTFLALTQISNLAFAQTLSSSRIVQPNCQGTTTTTCMTPTRAPQYSDFCSDVRLNSYLSFVSGLRDYVSPDQYGDLLVPIRTAANHTKNVLQVFGPYHTQTKTSFIELMTKLNEAEVLWGNLEQIDIFAPIINDIRFVTMSLERDLYL